MYVNMYRLWTVVKDASCTSISSFSPHAVLRTLYAMTDLLAARSQMAMSLAFHIVFACAGIAMPLLMVLSERMWLKTRQEVYLELTKRWARGTAILFAVGAVSGTVLSFELGLLWPGFMKYAGAIIGMPFSLEGFAFFTEAIFLGLYLYGWNRLSPRTHLLTGVLVAFSGMISGVFVVCANAWMNAPAGFEMVNGEAVNIRPFAAMFNEAWVSQTLHMTIAAYLSTGAAVTGIHALMLLRDPDNGFHRAALRIALPMTIISAFLQPISGDISARDVAHRQPEKFAAMEALFKTQEGAPFHIGGIPDAETQTVSWTIEIPKLLSLLTYHDPDAKVTGLDAFPRDEWPNTFVVHIAFQIMIACGTALMLVSAAALWIWWRKRTLPVAPWLLKCFVVVSPLGFIAVEAGWFVTEVGRQPWIIYRVMKTADAVTPMPWLVVPFVTYSIIYLFLAVIVTMLLWWQVLSSPTQYRRRS